jgi:hypothetical protein
MGKGYGIGIGNGALVKGGFYIRKINILFFG